MTEKNSLAILGLLHSNFGCGIYYVGEHHKTKNSIEELSDHPELDEIILDYLKSLKMSYSFAKDIITDDYGSCFYHKELGFNSQLLPKKYNKKDLCTSDHDAQIWITDEGRIGIWCEVDGFVAWLDEYKKVWIVDSREEIKKRREKYHKWFEEHITPLIKQAVEKTFSEENNHKINKIEMTGLADYSPATKEKNK